MNIVFYVFFFILAIGVLVTVHEFGHYWVARQLGVRVLRFSVGFGRPIWKMTGGQDKTEYVIAAVPLGGYVKMLDERDSDVPSHELHRAFNRQRLWVRSAVVVAGPLANFLFAILAYWVMLVVGVSGPRPLIGELTAGSIADVSGLTSRSEIVAVDGRDVKTWEGTIQAVLAGVLDSRGTVLRVKEVDGAVQSIEMDLSDISVDDLTDGQFFDRLGIRPARPNISPVIGHIEARGPADVAGLTIGDRVVQIDGQLVPSWDIFVQIIRASPDKALVLSVMRGDSAPLSFTLVPEPVVDAGITIGRIGAGVKVDEAVLASYYSNVRLGVLESLPQAFVKSYDLSLLTLKMFWKMLMLEVSLQNLSGPISIAQYAGYSAKMGPSKFIEFLALVSISLGILNLLPIPVLDGGHLMYYLSEALTGRPVSDELQIVGQRIGIAMLLLLMGLALYNDVTRLFG